jgi:uncharacterized protein YoxC
MEEKLQTGKRWKVLAGISGGCWLVLVVLICYGLSYMNKMMLYNAERFDAMEKQIDLLREETGTNFKIQQEYIQEQIEASAGQLNQSITEGLGRAGRNIAAVNNHVSDIEKVYGDLLAEQQKKTLDSLYNEAGLMERVRAAGEFFKEGKYRQAYEQYDLVAREDPENEEVQFYRYYSLFLINKADRGQYRQIRNGLAELEKRGYTRVEITEVLEYIAGE